jgi:hypothetical protein
MQLLEIPFAVFGLICAVVIVFALFQKVEDPRNDFANSILKDGAISLELIGDVVTVRNTRVSVKPRGIVEP